MKRFTAITLAALMVLAVFASVIPTSAVEVTSYEFMDGIDEIGAGNTTTLTSLDAPSILYYAFDDKQGEESLFINYTDTKLEADDDDIVYTTKIYTLTNGDKEVAYLGNPYAVITSDTSEWILSQKLVDEDDEDDYTLRVGESLSFPEGWELTANGIDVDGGKVWLTLSKDGEEKDSGVTDDGGYYVYKEDLDDDGTKDDVVMNATVDSVFAGMTTNMVILNDIDLFSNDVKEIEDGSTDEINDYIVDSTTAADVLDIRLDTDESESLTKDSTKEILGGFVSVKLNEDGDLAAVVKIVSTPGTYEFMDGIDEIGAGNTTTLTSLNAPSILYYAFDDKQGEESLFINYTDTKLDADDDDIVYTTKIYTLTNGDKEVAYLGNPYAVITSDTSEWILSQKLVDEDDEDDYTLRVGESLSFPEGWELTANEIDVDGGKVWLTLSKDGEEKDSGVTDDGGYYVYKEDLDDDGTKDDVVMNATVDSVFAGMTTNMVILNDIDLFSNDVKEIEDGSTDEINDYIVDLTTAADVLDIRLDTDESESLTKDSTKEILGGFVSVKLNEDGDLAAAVKTVTIGGEVEDEVVDEEVVDEEVVDEEVVDEEVVDEEVIVDEVVDEEVVVDEVADEVVDEEPPEEEPGFEAIFAIAGLLAVAFLVRRNK